MTVTISINNNYEYVDQNCPELIEKEDFSDIAADYGYNTPHIVKHYPFELNVANSNFGLIWRNLGLVSAEEDFSEWCCGEIDSQELYKLLLSFSPAKITYSPYQEGIMYDCGVDMERASRYYWNLMKIVREALDRNESIVWG